MRTLVQCCSSHHRKSFSLSNVKRVAMVSGALLEKIDMLLQLNRRCILLNVAAVYLV